MDQIVVDALRLLAEQDSERREAALAMVRELTTYIDDAPAAETEMRRVLSDLEVEHFAVLCLDAKHRPIGDPEVVHVGTLTMCVVGAREVFRAALRKNACSIIVAHNHPSGDPTPSPEDVEVTKKLASVGNELDITLLDHLVIGRFSSVSLRKQGCR